MRLTPILAALFLAATSISARDSHVGHGSAIVSAYSIRSEALEPGAEVALLACVTNDNPHSVREVATGDRFTLALGGGAILGCDGIDVHSPSGSLTPSDFSCETTSGTTVTLVHDGPTTTWTPGDQVCATLRFLAPAASASVRCTYEVANEGAYAPPMPHYLVLGVGDELGIRGPQGTPGVDGPTGATGPQGPSAVGGRWQFVSSGEVAAFGGSPPVEVPGLSGSVTVGAGSSLSIVIDALSYGCPQAHNVNALFMPLLLLEIDGTAVAQRPFDADFMVSAALDAYRSQEGFSWLSPPLSPGSHTVRVLVWHRDGLAGWRAPCVGGGSVEEKQSRLIVIELRQ